MENYICINGKKAELTEEQMKALGIELPKPNPFARVCNKANDFYHYYFITSYGTIAETVDHGFEQGNGNDDLRFRNANYCTDEELLKQRALHETLNRLLWRYSMEHDRDKIDKVNPVVIRVKDGYYSTYCTVLQYVGDVYFACHETANNAIKEIIEPFMKAHPEFKW